MWQTMVVFFVGAVAAIKHSKFMYGFSQIDSGAAGLSIE